MQTMFTVIIIDCRFERYKNNTSAERGAVKSPVCSDDAFSPDEVLMIMVMVVVMLVVMGLLLVVVLRWQLA